ncbi:MAG: chorismate mutase [Alphaproteobacteria bacterium]|nr:chorismate mutase [Alphaproteobacteria bacterium]
MASSPPDLDDLRRRIDEIDDKLQDLLIERVEVVSAVAARKRNGSAPAHQPAREAEILRRLVARQRGPFPTAILVRMWREMLAATVRLQGPFAVAVYAPPEAQGYWDLARDHYGSHTPMFPYRSIGQVFRAVTDGQAAAGVLPMPQEGEADPWWRHLLSMNDNAPRVIARLPFAARGNARTDGGDALAIGRGVQQETGQDRTLVATENAVGISRGRIFEMLSSLGLVCTFFASYEHAEGGNNLFEFEGFVPISDPRLERFRARLGAALHRLMPFGGYAVPLSGAAVTGAAPAGARPPVPPRPAASPARPGEAAAKG